jgi:hypothetical protein
MSTQTKRKHSQKPRWQEFQARTFMLPDADSATAAISKELPADKPCSETDPLDYPHLRILLRDRELPFKPIFSQGDVAQIIGKSNRTVRNWISKNLTPFHVWPTGEPYFSPQDLEDLLAPSGDRKGEAM